jgi:putative tricarboxylic transport membrane protein
MLFELAQGFQTALSFSHLFYCFLGVTLGTLIGVLPGIGPVATIAMLLPITYGLDPLSALIMLAGIYYGAQYGGSTSAILINLPGETSSVVTCLDGYAMAHQGRAGTALGIAALSSFFAGSIATFFVALLAVPLSSIALRFGPSEYFSLMVLGLVAALVLAHGSIIKALGMTLIGLILGTVGTDTNSGVERFVFGIPELSDGFGFVVISMGLFGISEIMINVEKAEDREVKRIPITQIWPRFVDLRDAWKAALRGTLLGSVFGVLPGGGAVLAAFASYTLEKKLSNEPSRFGRGAIEGVAGPEAANNAGAQTSFIPLLTLGIPANAVMALMIGAMMIHGVVPGPQVVTDHPDLFWGLIASMWIGNGLLVLLNLPLIGLWVKLLQVPYRLLYPSILLFCSIGIYSLNQSALDIFFTTLFGLIGYLFKKLDCEPAPLLLGFVLGPFMEENLRRAMLLSHGDPSVFVTRPISAGLLIAALILLGLIVLPFIKVVKSIVREED